MRNDLLSKIIEQNPFDIPPTLINSQTRLLAQNLVQELKQQKYSESVIQKKLQQELKNIHQTAEKQVRNSLILEAIAQKENISISAKDIQKEINQIAAQTKTDEAKLREYYSQHAEQKRKLGI